VRDEESVLTAACAISDAIDREPMGAQDAVSPPRAMAAPMRALADLIHAWRGRQPAARADSPSVWGGLRILRQIGEGTFSDVFQAHDPDSGREVALKLLKPGPWPSEAVAHEIIKDCHALARVRHANVIAIYGAARHDGRLGIWMEHLRGRTLEQCLAERGPLAAQDAILAGLDVCRGAAAVHRAGLLHGDIKAQNVVRTSDGRNVLIDVGGCRAAAGVRPQVAGTPLCAAPEILAWRPANVRSEVYSIGVLLYHLVTGEYPVTGRSLPDLRAAHAAGHRQTLAQCRPGLPDAFVAVVERALAHRPSQRYAAAPALQAALARLIDGPAHQL